MKKAIAQIKAFGAKLAEMIFSERILKLVFFRCAHKLAKMTPNTLDDQIVKELETMSINKTQEDIKG